MSCISFEEFIIKSTIFFSSYKSLYIKIFNLIMKFSSLIWKIKYKYKLNNSSESLVSLLNKSWSKAPKAILYIKSLIVKIFSLFESSKLGTTLLSFLVNNKFFKIVIWFFIFCFCFFWKCKMILSKNWFISL